MSYRSLAIFALSLSVVLGLSTAASAQMAPVSGQVLLENADGTKTPVAGAVIEVYRTDIKAGFPSGKTDKSGRFTFAGMPYVGRFIFSVSAPGASPLAWPNVRPGQENLVLILVPGDGRKFTEAEARAGATAAASAGEMTAEEKKALEELKAKNAAIAASNEKIKNADEVARKSADEGRQALKAQDWDTALVKFDAGIAAVPDFVGSTPVLINGRMAALKQKGFLAYRAGMSQTDVDVRKAKFEEANKHYDAALASFSQALKIIDSAEAGDAAEMTRRLSLKSDLYNIATEIHRLKAVGGVDTSKAAEAREVINTYVKLETNPERKLGALVALGDIGRLTGDFATGIAAYKQALELKPDSDAVLGKLGLTLFAQGVAVVPEDKALQQEGLNYMQKYADSAVAGTDTDQDKELRASVKQAVDYLKAQKMAPQKVSSPAKKKTN